MKPIDAHECQVQILVCTNERPPEKSSCKRVGGQEFYDRLKAKLKETHLNNTHWVTRTGCLGFCNNVGTTVVIQPKGKEPRWYSEVKAEDFDAIWEELTRA
jgi:(2Fe-2S) ferredoxin